MEHLVLEIEKRLSGLKNAGFFTIVRPYTIMGETRIKFAIATSDKLINNVSGQYPDLISFSLTDKLELQSQIFGGNGGQSLYRNIIQDDPKEKYLAMAREKVPFRKPQQTEKAVLSAIERLTINYYETLVKIQKMGLLRYGDLADYETLLK